MSNETEPTALEQPLVYDLYCGHGGVGLALADLEVNYVGMDKEDRSATYPGRFIRGDGSRPPLSKNPDLLWMSPPCTAYSRMSYMAYDNPREELPTFDDLRVREVIDEFSPEEYIIENVALCDELRSPTRINGFAFGKEYELERHFETSFDCPDALEPGKPTLTISTAEGADYHVPQLADAKGVPRSWGEQAIHSAIPREYVLWLLHHCPVVDAPKPQREQTMLTETVA